MQETRKEINQIAVIAETPQNKIADTAISPFVKPDVSRIIAKTIKKYK